MKRLFVFTLMLSSFSAFSHTVMDCHSVKNKNEISPEPIGQIIVDQEGASLFQGIPSETVLFSGKQTDHKSTRTGTWSTFTQGDGAQKTVLVIEDSGSARRAYINHHNVETGVVTLAKFSNMRCFEK